MSHTSDLNGSLSPDPVAAKRHNGKAHPVPPRSPRKQRVTITLPVTLLERLRNAVYWTGHSTLACLIADSLDEVVTQMEEANKGPFPKRLAPLKRGRPPLRPRCLTDKELR